MVKNREERFEQEYPVIKAMYRLTLEFSHQVKNFPRDSRFILGDRILNNCYDLLEGLVEARYAKQREKILFEQNLRLEKLRFQMRLCLDMNIINPKQYGRMAEQVNEVGKMIGGWLKSLHP